MGLDMDRVEISEHMMGGALDWSTEEIPSLKGKVAIVTGANSLSSIGGHIAHQLALKGAKVYIGARNFSKATAGIKEILAQSPSIDPSNLEPFVAAVDDYAQVTSAAKAFLKSEERLDILINNAGILPLAQEFDQYGVNKVMATNHLGPFLLTRTLLPLLKKTSAATPDSDVRIVNVSSGAIEYNPPGHTFASLDDWNNDFGGEDNEMEFMHRYAYSKVANVLFTKELQRRIEREGSRIIVMAAHPGMVATPGAEKVLGADSKIYKSSITPYKGALTELWCSAHPQVRYKEHESKGAFFVPYGVAREVVGLAANMEEAKMLWDVSEKILAEVVKV